MTQPRCTEKQHIPAVRLGIFSIGSEARSPKRAAVEESFYGTNEVPSRTRLQNDASGAYSDASVTVTVTDPNTFYAATKTVCVSPSSNFTGCPSGAAQQTAMPSDTSINRCRPTSHAGAS